MMQAVQDRASDIHFEPFEDEFKIRYRVDGALYKWRRRPNIWRCRSFRAIKVMANLTSPSVVCRRRAHQHDGRQPARSTCAFPPCPRNSANPSCCGVLDRGSVNLDLKALGLPKSVNEYIHEAIQQPNGIFVVTGPTGSGKTTTLYACLRQINGIDVKLLTVEDPVEYDIDGIMQVAVNDAVGMTSARRCALLAARSRCHHARGNARSGNIPDRHSSVAHRHLS